MRSYDVEVWGSRATVHEAGDGEPVLYLHGFPTSGYLWRNVMHEMQGFRAIACDFPGFGRSELLGEPHTWENLKSWVSDLLAALDIDNVHLAVHDWGGLIGLPWFCENHERVKSLLITDTSFSSSDRWHAMAVQWREPGVGEETIGAMTRDGFEAIMRMGSPTISNDALDEYWRGLSTLEHRIAKLEMYRSLDFEMFEPYMASFPGLAQGKTRVVWGAGDPFVPRKVADRFGARTGAEVTVLEDAGHFLQEDAGPMVGKLHREFLISL